MDILSKYNTDIVLGDVGSYFQNGSSELLRATTFVHPSVVIPRVRRLFNFWGAIDEYRPQRQRGLFADKDFCKGTYIGTYEGFVIDIPLLTDMGESTDYVLWDKSSKKGILGDNQLRMANHTPISRANMTRLGFNFFAASDILGGEELTWSYDGSDKGFNEPTDSSIASQSGPAARPK